MSRIEEALRRIAGGSAEPRRTSGLEGYAPEKGYQPEDSRGPAPVFPSGPVRVEAKPPVSQPVAVPPPIVHAQPDQAEESESPADAEKLIDFRTIADYGRFVGASVWRHKLLALATFSLVLGLTAALTILLPKTYSAETKLLAQRNEVMAALSNPGRAIPWDADAPTRAASETVLRRDNLIALIRETDLVNEWKRTRVPVLRLKDWVMSFMRPPLTQAEQIDQLVGMLEARIVVQAGPVGDGTVTISLTWPDAQMAYRLVQAAQRAFIDARQVAERTAIGESIGILERYSATLHENINTTLAELQRTQAKGRASSGRRGTAGARIPESIPMATEITAGGPEAPDLAIRNPGLRADRNDPAIPRLRESLAFMRQEIATLEEQRQHQLSDLQAQLARLTAVYTPAHPMVLSTQQH